jgi:hypothetical protein
MAGDRSVRIGGNAVGNVITTGDHNAVEAHVAATHAGSPIDPVTVDVAEEIAAIREILRALTSEHEKKIGRALDDADEEASKQAGADRNELGNALDRALRLAKSAAGFAETAAKLVPHVHNAVAWLGDKWTTLLTHLA